MLTTRPIRHKKMAEQIRDAVTDYIRDHRLKVGDRIPTEAKLCAAFGVSRPSVREALRLLEQERLIVTEHGRGRFVTAAATLNIARPITVFESISRMLAALGYAPDTRVLSTRTILAGSDPQAAAALGLQPEVEIYVLERLREAEGQALVYSIDVVPMALLGTDRRGRRLQDRSTNFWPASNRSRLCPAQMWQRHSCLTACYRSRQRRALVLCLGTCLSEIGTPVFMARDYHRGSLISFKLLAPVGLSGALIAFSAARPKQHLLKKCFRALTFRRGEEVLMRTLFHDPACIHEDHPIRNLPGKAHLMRTTDMVMPSSARPTITSSTS